jgi:hypothetical protein
MIINEISMAGCNMLATMHWNYKKWNLTYYHLVGWT